MPTIRIFIIDDEAYVRIATIAYLADFEDLLVVGEASDGSSAVATFREHSPTIILLDISMPKLNGFETAQRILALDSKAKIIMLSSLSRKICLEASLEVGALDFVEKANYEALVPAIRKIS